jgi:hypothetical protein
MAPERLPALPEACARAGVTLEFCGGASGNPTAAPEALLGRYDLVFAKARCALEALAVGAAVVLCDPPRMGPLVTRAGVERLRTVAGREAAVDRLIALYDEVVADHRAHPPEAAAERAATAAYLRALRLALGPPLSERAELMDHCHRLGAALGAARAEREALAAERARLAAAEAASVREAALRDRLAAERDALGERLAVATGSATYRLREWLLASRLLGTPLRLLVRAARGRVYD